jgi:hypothetical protein
MSDIRFSHTALTDDEVLALYNSTKNAVGVRPAERSFTHRLQPEVDANTVAAFDMSTKNSDGTLMDLSGNSNHGDIYGAVRSGGYFTDGMRFDGVDDYIDLGFESTFDVNGHSFFLECLFSATSYPSDNSDAELIMRNDGLGSMFMLDYNDSQEFRFYINGVSPNNVAYTIDPLTNRIYHLVGVLDGDIISLYLDGLLVASSSISGSPIVSSGDVYIGRKPLSSNYFEGDILISNISQNTPDVQSRFNSLATLPLYTFDASKYPTSSGWTANVPYSSMSISSGEFSFTDNGQLQCDSAGSFSLRNSHPFDADEYIKLTINGVEYAGTGSVTEGNVTVSLTQGSNKISVNMGTGDVIDGIDIQFREPVE